MALGHKGEVVAMGGGNADRGFSSKEKRHSLNGIISKYMEIPVGMNKELFCNCMLFFF